MGRGTFNDRKIGADRSGYQAIRAAVAPHHFLESRQSARSANQEDLAVFREVHLRRRDGCLHYAAHAGEQRRNQAGQTLTGDGDDDLLPNWYRYLGPSDEYPWSVHSMGLDEVPGGDGKRFRVTVGTEPDPHTGNTGSLFWYFDDKGNCTGRLTPSAFTQRFGEGADPKNFSWKSSLD